MAVRFLSNWRKTSSLALWRRPGSRCIHMYALGKCPVLQSIRSGHGIVPCTAACAYVSKGALVNSTSEEGRLTKTIRQACKTGNSSAAFEAFSQLCAMDYSMNPDVLNSMLRVSAMAGDEDAFTSILDVIKSADSKQNIVTQSLVISGLCEFGHSGQALELCRSLEEKESLVPRQQALQAVLRASIKSGLSEGVSYALRALQSRRNLPESGHSVALVEAVTQGPLQGDHDLVLQLLSLYESLGRPADVTLLTGIAAWAATYPHSACARTHISDSGQCANCGLQLRDMLISKEEFTWLFSRAEQLLNEEVQSLENNGKVQVEVNKLKRMVKEVGPFDVVIDGLNVGHTGKKGFSLDKLLDVAVGYADNQKKKVLVIVRGHVRKHMTKRSKLMKQSDPYERYLNQVVYFFYTQNRVIDDYYFLYATLASGMQALFVSNDTLGDHIADFPLTLLECFRKWQQSRQVNVGRSEGRHAAKVLQYPPQYQTVVQCHDAESGRHWHLPSPQGNQWLCLHGSLHGDAKQWYKDCEVILRLVASCQ